MAVSKRLRFEVFRRDGFRCRYCGRAATEAELQVDHVVPETLGGNDDPANLVTACNTCNAGKSSAPLDGPVVAQVADDALRWAGAMRQAAAEAARDVAGHTEVHAAVKAEWYRGRLPDDWTVSIDRFLDAGLPAEVIVKMATVAQSKMGGLGDRFAYFCGCCWTRIRQLQERAQEIVRQAEPTTDHTAPLWVATTWTLSDIDDLVDRAVTAAAEAGLGVDSAYCAHTKLGADWPCCDDPLCRISWATTLHETAMALSVYKWKQACWQSQLMDQLDATEVDDEFLELVA